MVTDIGDQKALSRLLSRSEVKNRTLFMLGWFRGAAVKLWPLTGELSPSCARHAADG